ncbi:MAG TPA: triphosphoribosyl-dephospho-CoA synthase [Eubacteriales bacterium]|nr:triphosphoribosyl-dephospho-CoA synthase [Eubacteriales bacterium]
MIWSPELIGQTAYEALVFEARLTPKPGLVDAENNGAHTDMDLTTLLKGAEAIRPFLGRFAQAGVSDAALPPNGRLSAIRADGVEAEKAMLLATGGVNTHKGAIFLLGVLCYAAGRRSELDEKLRPLPIAAEAALVCEGVSKELGAHAGRAFLRYGARGARGEAEAGYPGVVSVALPAYHEAIAANASEWDAWLIALLRLIERTDDANVLDRCGDEIASELKKSARQIANRYLSGGENMLDEIRALDEQCRMWRASPGGSADLLACAKFLQAIEQSN